MDPIMWFIAQLRVIVIECMGAGSRHGSKYSFCWQAKIYTSADLFLGQ